jgi:hypothetical protein
MLKKMIDIERSSLKPLYLLHRYGCALACGLDLKRIFEQLCYRLPKKSTRTCSGPRKAFLVATIIAPGYHIAGVVGMTGLIFV